MLLQLEQDCLDVYKRKVEHAAKSRAQLLQALSDAKIELSTLLSALGEKSFAGIVRNYFSFALLSEAHNTITTIYRLMMH
jgi:protein regulator of cytokinesis 1